MSDDGRYVAYYTKEADAAVDNNVMFDVYRFDQHTGVNSIVSVDASGTTVGTKGAALPTISADGNWVVFGGDGTTLVGGTTAIGQVIEKDMTTGATFGSSYQSGGSTVWLNGVGPTETDMSNPALTDTSLLPSGRPGYVAFVFSTCSNANVPIATGTSGALDVYLRDNYNATTYLVSGKYPAATGPITTMTYAPVLQDVLGISLYYKGPGPVSSTTGTNVLVAFSTAAQLLPADTNMRYDVYIYDHSKFLQNIVPLTLVSLNASGAILNQSSTYPSLSPSGQLVSFTSAATDPYPFFLDLNGLGATDVFYRNWSAATPTNTLVSRNLSGNEASGASIFGWFSRTADIIAFDSSAYDLVSADSNGVNDVFAFDVTTGAITRESLSWFGQELDQPSLSNKGCVGNNGYLAFESSATNALGGVDTNGVPDAFLRGPIVLPNGTAFCLGDGTGTPCPCTPTPNNGAPGHGCASSAFSSGALLTATGTSSVSGDCITLTCTNMSGPGYFVQYDATAGAPFAFGDGVFCLAGNMIRLNLAFPVGNMASYPTSASQTPISVAGAPVLTMPVGPRYYQMWYREASPMCGSFPFNLSNGLQLVWVP